MFKKYSLRLRNLHASMNRALTDRLVELERENHVFRAKNKMYRNIIKCQRDALVSSNMELDVDANGELTDQEIRAQILSAKSQLSNLERWLKMAKDE